MIVSCTDPAFQQSLISDLQKAVYNIFKYNSSSIKFRKEELTKWLNWEKQMNKLFHKSELKILFI